MQCSERGTRDLKGEPDANAYWVAESWSGGMGGLFGVPDINSPVWIGCSIFFIWQLTDTLWESKESKKLKIKLTRFEISLHLLTPEQPVNYLSHAVEQS